MLPGSGSQGDVPLLPFGWQAWSIRIPALVSLWKPFLKAHAGSGMKLANANAWIAKLPALEDRCRLGKVYGTLSAAMASLLDAGFEIPDIGRWIDPSGGIWALDFSQPMAIPAIRQVLTYFLQIGIWHRASNHTFGASLGLYPDLKPLKSAHTTSQETIEMGGIILFASHRARVHGPLR